MDYKKGPESLDRTLLDFRSDCDDSSRRCFPPKMPVIPRLTPAKKPREWRVETLVLSTNICEYLLRDDCEEIFCGQLLGMEDGKLLVQD